MAKPLLRAQAVELRKAGYSYSYIRKKIPVSLGTLAEWLSQIPYQPNAETAENIGKARIAAMMAKRNVRKQNTDSAIQYAKKDIGNMSERDIFMLGLGIYIGEGSKTHDNIRVVNSDPRIIRFAIRWFKDKFAFDDDNFRLRLHLYPDSNIEECLSFWSKELNISQSLFQKTQIDFRIDKKAKKTGKLPYGTAHLSTRSKGNKEHGVFLARRINGWIQEVLK